MNRLPAEVVSKDHALEKATDNASQALMEHRWHWTLDESNLDRVSLREYARQVSRHESLIRRYVHGFELLQDAHSGVRSPEEARARAVMTAETEAAVEAVADARGVQFGYASKEFASEARNIRETARQRAEEKGTSTLDEIPQAAAITYKRQRAEREENERRAERPVMRTIQCEARLLEAQRALIRAIQESEHVNFSREEREMLRETLNKVKHLIVIADRAIADAYDQGWKQEFRLLEGGLAS